jgi:hypothetical protein
MAGKRPPSALASFRLRQDFAGTSRRGRQLMATGGIVFALKSYTSARNSGRKTTNPSYINGSSISNRRQEL